MSRRTFHMRPIEPEPQREATDNGCVLQLFVMFMLGVLVGAVAALGGGQ